MVAIGLLVVLGIGAPPEVQRPSPRAEDPVAEPGIAPARVEATEAGPEADPALAPVEVEPEPATEPEGAMLPAYDPTAEPVGEGPDALPSVDAPVAPGTRREVDRGSGPPPGTALLGVGTALATAVQIDQATTLIICGTQACERAWIVERLLLLSAVGMVSGGGYLLGAHQAWADEVKGRTRKTKVKKIAGLTFFAIGLATMIVDAGFTGACYASGDGPYVLEDAFAYTCRSGLSAGMQDIGAITAGLGGGFGFSALGYERYRKGHPLRTSFGVAPMIGARQTGLRLAVTF